MSWERDTGETPGCCEPHTEFPTPGFPRPLSAAWNPLMTSAMDTAQGRPSRADLQATEPHEGPALRCRPEAFLVLTLKVPRPGGKPRVLGESLVSHTQRRTPAFGIFGAQLSHIQTQRGNAHCFQGSAPRVCRRRAWSLRCSRLDFLHGHCQVQTRM